jgi:hypothetical protein
VPPESSQPIGVQRGLPRFIDIACRESANCRLGKIPELVIKGPTERVRALEGECAAPKNLETAVAHCPVWSSLPYVQRFVRGIHLKSSLHECLESLIFGKSLPRGRMSRAVKFPKTPFSTTTIPIGLATVNSYSLEHDCRAHVAGTIKVEKGGQENQQEKGMNARRSRGPTWDLSLLRKR